MRQKKEVLLVMGLLALTACKKSSDSNPPPPPPAAQTQTFSGSLSTGGKNTHAFNASQRSTVAITLTTTNPPNTPLGVGVGIPDGSNCTLVEGASVVTFAGSTAQLTGTVTPGAYCLVVYDAENLTGSVNYSVNVTITPSAAALAPGSQPQKSGPPQFIPERIAPSPPQIQVPPRTPTTANPILSGRPIIAVSPDAPTSYVPLISDKGFNAFAQEHDLSAQGDKAELTLQDQVRPHGNLGVINTPNR